MPMRRKKVVDQEKKIDQKKVDNWYALTLARTYKTTNVDELRAAALFHGVYTTTKLHDSKWNPLVTIRDEKLRILGQKPYSYFITQ